MKDVIRFTATIMVIILVSLSLGLTGAFGVKILRYKQRGFPTKEATEWAIDDFQNAFGIDHVPKSIRDAMDNFGWEYTVNKNVAVLPCVDLGKER